MVYLNRGRTYAEKLRFLRKKRAGYANLKMPCVYCTQKAATSHIKMRLVFSFFASSREGCRALAVGLNIIDFPRPLPSIIYVIFSLLHACYTQFLKSECDSWSQAWYII